MSDNYEGLQEAIDAAVEEENSRRHMPDDHGYVVEVNTHASGPALDIWREEGDERVVPDKVHGPLVKPAIEEGFIPSGTNRAVNTSLARGDHVRIFLRDAEEYHDSLVDDEAIEAAIEDEVEEARAEGFAAGLFFATLVAATDGLQ